jgi:integrase
VVVAEKLDGRRLKDLAAPKSGNKIYYDSEVVGLGCRVTAAGARAFILNYRTRSGRERRYTIGPVSEWSLTAAREEAKELKKKIGGGTDPLAEIRADREAPTVADMCERFREEHLPKKRPATQRLYSDVIDRAVLPKLRHFKVVEVTFADIDGLHRKITKDGAPYYANRALSVITKMFNLAIHWKWRLDNPAKGVERNQEFKRERYLSAAELARLSEALAKYSDPQAANVVRLLLLTGARSGEVLAMRWKDLDLEDGIWTKPGSTTKQKTTHRVPLSAPARQVLAELAGEAEAGAEFVFPSRKSHRSEVRNAWRELCETACIASARPHDLRHTHASILASSGHSLPIIGRLLGHSQPATTARYAHLQDDPLRLAAERVGAIVTGKTEPAEVMEFPDRKRR